MTKKVVRTGGCLCGAIQYEVLGDPVRMVNCHCRDCQRSSGGGHTSTMIVRSNDVRVTKGSPEYYAHLAESGHSAIRGFCSVCGSSLFARSSKSEVSVGIQAGTLDAPEIFKPAADVWTISAQHWDVMDPALPKFERNRTSR